MRAFREPLLWFSLRTRVRHVWRVYLSTPTLSPFLETGACEGYTEAIRRQVVLDIRYPWARIERETCPHELTHVALCEREIEVPEDEERMVVLTSVPLFWVYRQLGAAMPPKPPRYAEFRRWARKVDPMTDT